MVDEALAARLVAEQFPGLGGARVESYGAGWDNTVFLIGGAWVFRFPRREIAVELLQAEARILPRIAARLPMPVPEPIWLGQPSAAFPWPFTGYRRLPGQTACRAGLDDAVRARAAAPLGEFLAALHSIEATDLHAPADTLARADMHQRTPLLLERLAALQKNGLVADAGPWRALIESTPPPPPAATKRLCHGDLYARHVLVDPAGAPCGVIDWGDVHLGDPAVDLALAIGFLPRAARDAFQRAYGPIDADRWTLARLRALFHAVAVVAYGHDVGDAALLGEGLVAMRFTLE